MTTEYSTIEPVETEYLGTTRDPSIVAAHLARAPINGAYFVARMSHSHYESVNVMLDGSTLVMRHPTNAQGYLAVPNGVEFSMWRDKP